MAVTLKEEFAFYIRHLKDNDLDAQIKIAKSGWEKMEKGQRFESPEEKFFFVKSLGFLEDIYRAEKLPDEKLKKELHLSCHQLKDLSDIAKKIEAENIHGYTPGFYHEGSSEIIKNTVFDKLGASPGPASKNE